MKILALTLIDFYKKRLSPHKGYCCSYRQYTGRASCSTLAYRAIQRFGVLRGTGILRQRFVKCGVAYRRHAFRSPVLQRQAGFCDLSCDLPCDIDLGSATCDLLSNCGSPCDGGSTRSSRKNQKKDKYVHIPPNIKW
jgi:putative component of membrane protein insertase Oxa1/YidC/SpoIIIJ protein YidD